MKTLIVYNDLEIGVKFTILDGDFSRFNGICVNSMLEHAYESEFLELFFEVRTGDFKYDLSSDISLLENKNWDKVALITFLP